MLCAFSREPPYKPDGSKIYVQDLVWEQREALADAILKGKGYVYICGDAKNMSKRKANERTRTRGLLGSRASETEYLESIEIRLWIMIN